MKESRKTQYTRKALADGMIELMKSKPFDKITVKELCDCADINRSTFYMHYEDIYALLHSIEDDTLDWMRKVLGELSGTWQENREAAVHSLQRFFEYMVENSKYLQVLMSEQGNIAFQKQVFFSACQACDITPESKFTPPFSEDIRLIYVVNGGVGIVRHWLKNGLKETPRELAETIYDLTLSIR
ncbi:MAG: TetR family transcriptional regulator C-terminal domain-containing protein [Oscillospiraceae bacterium]|nr:TetR family transcriptional regulator C-terminal domain-containing protein [Oscillospiraceae bacterium]